MHNMTTVGARWIALLATAWLAVVGVGLFIPLMDNDSAHHANIALRMYLTGDYVNLVDYDGPYLDKPHLHFWLSALSYHLFGVSGFAYKFPSFLFSLVGIWAVYRSAILLINRSAGAWAALIYATSASFLLALNDVRMDAILTACVAISIWQIAGYWSTQHLRYVLGTALGLALGFCTKGHVGVLVPLLFALSFSFFSNNWKPLLSLKIFFGVLFFFLLISPVVYCYYLQYNLHPELVVRGQNQIDGVRFILWEQSLGRYSGEMGSDASSDRFFFFHTFLWVFAPWSLLGFLCLFTKKEGGLRIVSRTALLVLVVFGVLVGFSSFKLPHYLNVVLPLCSLWIADTSQQQAHSFIRHSRGVEWLMWALIGVVAGLVLIWWFPQQPTWFWVGLFIFFFFLFYTIRGRSQLTVGDQVIRLCASVLVVFWIVNAAFYKNLLLYQGGSRLAQQPEIRLLAEKKIYSLEGCYSSSFYFYTRSLRDVVSVESVKNIKGLVLLDKKQEVLLKDAGVAWKDRGFALDYEITKLSLPFLDPEKRNGTCTSLKLVEVGGE